MDKINIYQTDKQVNLKEGTYHINLIGGWGVSLNQFKIELLDSNNKSIICYKTTFPVQNLTDKKTKRILSVDIKKADNYKISFKNPGSIEVYPSPLFLLKLILKPIDNKNIQVYFEFKK